MAGCFEGESVAVCSYFAAGDMCGVAEDVGICIDADYTFVDVVDIVVCTVFWADKCGLTVVGVGDKNGLGIYGGSFYIGD